MTLFYIDLYIVFIIMIEREDVYVSVLISHLLPVTQSALSLSLSLSLLLSLFLSVSLCLSLSVCLSVSLTIIFFVAKMKISVSNLGDNENDFQLSYSPLNGVLGL